MAELPKKDDTVNPRPYTGVDSDVFQTDEDVDTFRKLCREADARVAAERATQRNPS